MIHQYKMDDLNIVLDIYSGAVHVVDDIVYDIIENYPTLSKAEIQDKLRRNYGEDAIQEAFEEVAGLVSEGLLFTEDTYKETILDFKNRQPVVKALCLHIAHDCNLVCRYCFAGEGEYHGDRSMMSSEVGKKAIDFLIQHSGHRKNLEIDFFGGEPLMNFDVVKEIVEYAKTKEEKHHKNFRFTITTNGVLLNDENMDYINNNMYNVVLSIDGRKAIHDQMRPASNGKGSYDLILPKFIQMAESRNQENYYVRGTFTHHNLDFSQDVLHLADCGFKQISVEPVVAPPNMPYALQEADMDTLCEQYDILAKEMLQRKKAGKAFNFFHFMIDLSQGPCVVKRLSGCGSGTEYLAVTPWGDLYPCHQFVGMEDFKMGDVDTGVTNVVKQNDFKGCSVYSKQKCQSCWAKFYCSGGCSANAYQFHGNIHDVYDMGCTLEKKRVECAIYLKAKEMLS
ncbi:thioether cross-link-forming SCIFF peptide maturase [Vallitalea pronyensis]|uniref:Thioether cross-link-forming SCIFF peptide maturase n=1 Tax=Vallitalea pronyensis TaxID=1348613 RepID=A0A8J8MPJ8_9FIRM|nr:thioether cross-link-forming SCIFF peptide maturase [Vallitalea pronyensis]QUI25757.1 thioether cross-link-forming SCIFF peptide maturase [Vallitalea pronyensis]